MHKDLTTVIVLVLGLISSPVMAEKPGRVEPGIGNASSCWQPGFFLDDLMRPPRAFVTFDDGMGEALYVGGSFESADGVTVNSIAKWDGTSWSPLKGSSGTGLGNPDHIRPSVSSLVVYDDGTGEALYVGGSFSTAGGLSVKNIAKWDGSSWSGLSGPLGTGTNNVVNDLAVYDDGTGEALFALGSFPKAGGVAVNSIAKWDGTSWSALSGPSGIGLNAYALALSVFDDGSGEALYAAGAFSMAGGATVNHIAKWDGTSWSALSGPSGVGMNNDVHVMAVYDDGGGAGLYAAGSFSMAGGVTVNRIVKWDGAAWSSLSGPWGTGMSDVPSALAVFDDGRGEALYVGGGIDWVGGIEVDHIARWDGTSWSALSGPSGTGMGGDSFPEVYSMGVFDDGNGIALYAGGSFRTAGGIPVNHIARWDGTVWSSLGESSGAGLNGKVFALATFDDGNGGLLYAGGEFLAANGVVVKGIAAWDGTSWSALSGPSGVGVNLEVRALAVYNDGTGEGLYAGGNFYEAGGVSAVGIARWDGTMWSALVGPSGNGVSHHVNALALFDDGGGEALYAGGLFATAGGIPAFSIARWDGTSWSDLNGQSGSGINGEVYSLSSFDDGSGPALYVGGQFTDAGGVPVTGIAKWDGVEWSRPCGPEDDCLGGAVYALAVYDDGMGEALYAGGNVIGAGGLNYIGKWDGTAWTALGGPSGNGMGWKVTALTVYDDGTGEGLYAGGWFTTAGGLPADYVAKWDGETWSALTGPSGNGLNYFVYALAVYDDGMGEALYAGGDFTTAGGWLSNSIAKWGRGCNFPIFADGFETGGTSWWSLSQP